MPHEVKREMRRRGIISLTPAPSPGGEGSDVPIDIVYIYIQIYNDKTELRAGYCVEGKESLTVGDNSLTPLPFSEGRGE
jgi:hypothetical protein